jgi:shikimate kinase
MTLQYCLEKLRDTVNTKHPTRYVPKHLREIGEERDEFYRKATEHARHEIGESPIQEIREHVKKRRDY